MRIGFVGLGKLGLPCALAVARNYHEVCGTDVSETPREILETKKYPHKELLAQHLLDTGTTVRWEPTVSDVVLQSEIVFCAIQTPHSPAYEGVTRVPQSRADFDYSYLREGVREICSRAAEHQRHIVLVVISTVLPGTVDRELRQFLEGNKYVSLVYNPFFIAMGTTIRDFLAPEFILLGVDDEDAARKVEAFYKSFIGAPIKRMSIRSAELTKVSYNTFIGLKIVLANTVMHICEQTGANCDAVMDALGAANERLISDRYLRSGMGDGGGCHPRDNIAMSWLAHRLGLGYDLFGEMMSIREKQTQWIADMAMKEAAERGLPIVVLGSAFKPQSNLTVGSCSTLLKNLIEEQRPVDQYDPEVEPESKPPWTGPCVFVLATPHDCFRTMPMPDGSVLLDPWGLAFRTDVTVKRIGRH